MKLKRIKPEQARLGMFIEQIDGTWTGTRFWRSRFILKCPKDLEALQAGNVKSIIISIDEDINALPKPTEPENRPPVTPENPHIARALQTINQVKPLIREIFNDARIDNSISIANSMLIVEQIAACMTDNSRALIAVSRLKTRDEYTFQHSIAVTALMVHLGRSINVDERTVKVLGLGGMLHDLGKMQVPIKVLNKAGPLSDLEKAAIRQHPSIGHEILSRECEVPTEVLDICLHHHERLDGTGYPNGLSENQLSLPVRIAAICDVYDALTSKRAYKKPWSPKDAAAFMERQKGQFDPGLLNHFFVSLNI